MVTVFIDLTVLTTYCS